MKIALVVLFICLSLALIHYLPWRALIGKELTEGMRHMMFVLSVVSPISIFWIVRGDLSNLALLWLALISGWIVEFGLTKIDDADSAHNRADIAEEEGEYLRGKIDKRD